jgi:hypothetical protein
MIGMQPKTVAQKGVAGRLRGMIQLVSLRLDLDLQWEIEPQLKHNSRLSRKLFISISQSTSP